MSQHTYEYLHASRAWIIILLNVIFLILALAFVGLRIYTRTCLRPGQHGREDWLLGSACFGLILLATTMILETRYGAGRHYDTATLQEYEHFFEVFYFSTICYQGSLYLVKSTLIVQYIRIFSTNHSTKAASWVTLVFLTCYSGALLIAGIFACKPIYAFWDLTYPGRSGACLHFYAMWYALAGLGIFTDFVIMIIPIPVVRELKLNRAQKAMTLALFGFGSFGVVASILRLWELYVLSTQEDGMWNSVQSVWSTIEVSVFIVCASVTGLKPLFNQKIYPHLSKFLPSSDAMSNTAGPLSRQTPPWMRSVTRRLGRRRPGTAAPRLSTIYLGTMRFGTLRPGDTESEIGIAPPVPCVSAHRSKEEAVEENLYRSLSRDEAASMYTVRRSESFGDHDGSITLHQSQNSETCPKRRSI